MQKHIRLKTESGSVENHLPVFENCGKPVEIEMPELEKENSGAGKSCLKKTKIDRKIHSNTIKIYVYYNFFAVLFGRVVYSAYICNVVSLYQGS